MLSKIIILKKNNNLNLGVILTYDITDRQSFKDIENWMLEVEKHASENVVRILVGNKFDLASEYRYIKNIIWFIF